MVIQRVLEASVTVDDEVCGWISNGLLVLLGIHQNDRIQDVPWMVSKLVHLRIFEDEDGKMNKSIKENHGRVLVVSQFTLYGNCKGGRRPDFFEAARPDAALPIYDRFTEEIKNELGHVQTGRFAAKMKVSLVNDGPVTLIIDSP